mmetsp:Transcript_21510/g.45994  ORF Transcript_21510/g.45994 Transcript_21510/m.45994 type:complete len:347 (+) Transcript_21510:1514-2554(+)
MLPQYPLSVSVDVRVAPLPLPPLVSLAQIVVGIDGVRIERAGDRLVVVVLRDGAGEDLPILDGVVCEAAVVAVEIFYRAVRLTRVGEGAEGDGDVPPLQVYRLGKRPAGLLKGGISGVFLPSLDEPASVESGNKERITVPLCRLSFVVRLLPLLLFLYRAIARPPPPQLRFRRASQPRRRPRRFVPREMHPREPHHERDDAYHRAEDGVVDVALLPPPLSVIDVPASRASSLGLSVLVVDVYSHVAVAAVAGRRPDESLPRRGGAEGGAAQHANVYVVVGAAVRRMGNRQRGVAVGGGGVAADIPVVEAAAAWRVLLRRIRRLDEVVAVHHGAPIFCYYSYDFVDC